MSSTGVDFFKRAFLGLALGAMAATAAAQSYPSKPVTLVIPFPAGGVTDVVGRAVASRLSAELGQNVIVDNRPGASGVLGSSTAARAAPDGYTLLLGNISTLSTNAATFEKLPYDPVASFAPVSMLAQQPLVIGVHASVPARSVAELVRLAKAKPGALTFGTAGSSIQLAVELFNAMNGIEMLHVPYKGSAPAITDLIGGQVNLLFDPISTLYPQVKEGRVIALAVTTAERSPVAPELPTVMESGLPEYDVSSWQALVVPAGTPAPIIARLHEAVTRVLAQPEIGEQLGKLGARPWASTPEAAAEFIRSEVERWRKVARQAGVTPQ